MSLGLLPVSSAPAQVAGRLKYFQANWNLITDDPWVLETIMGYKIEFHSVPHQVPWPRTFMSKAQQESVQVEVDKMILQGAIHPVTNTEGGFVSSIFLVDKKDGGHRPVINLKNLNSFVDFQHFKMEGIHMLRDLLKKGDFMVKLDLKDAYFTVPVWIGHQKYLRFLWKETLWEFACLPFGLASAPRTFTKIMKPVVATLRNLGIRLIIYLDDLLILADSEQTARLHLATAQNLLENLGFIINLKKSVLSPVQKIEFLGMTVDSLTLCLALPRDKVRGIRRECESLIANPTTTVRQLAHLLGRLSSSIQAVFPAPLYYRYLQQAKIQALRSGGHYESQVVLNQEAIEELQWWAENLMAWNGRALAQPDPSIIIESDASRDGWGAHCNGLSTGGLWSQSEQFLHINCLELLAGSFAIKCFAKDKTNIHIQLFMDNVTALTFINKMGGTKSRVLASLSRDLWQWCLQRQITVSATHIPGILNVNADRESRYHLDSSDWKLCPAVFQALQNRWGPLDLDLFASRLTNQLPRFVSWKPDPLSEAVDAFSLQWNKVKGYAFPPFCLLGRCLSQVLRQQVPRLVLVAPVWKTQPWYPLLLDLLIDPPVLLPQIPNLLAREGMTHPLTHLQLGGWLISGSSMKREAFLSKLEIYSQQLGGETPRINMPLHGASGLAGVLKGKSILFQHL